MAQIPIIAHGDIPFQLGGASINDTGLGELDALTLDLLTEWPNYRRGCSAAGYGKNLKIRGYHSMWVDTLNPQQEDEETAIVSVNCIGLLFEGDKRRRMISSQGRQISIGPIERVVLAWSEDEKGEDNGNEIDRVKRRVPKVDSDGDIVYKIIGTPSGFGDRWNINDPILTVQDVYFTTTKPLENVAGRPLTPPTAPTPPPYMWGGYGDQMRLQHPNGWVGVSMSVSSTVRFARLLPVVKVSL